MRDTIIRPMLQHDYTAWKPLWDSYNAFYGRVGPTHAKNRDSWVKYAYGARRMDIFCYKKSSY